MVEFVQKSENFIIFEKSVTEFFFASQPNTACHGVAFFTTLMSMKDTEYKLVLSCNVLMH